MDNRQSENPEQPVLTHIEGLVEEEHRLYGQGTLTDAERDRMAQLQVELDQCWDLLRRRRAARVAGKNPDQTEAGAVRPADVVERYEQ
jgi:hypothetical protein